VAATGARGLPQPRCGPSHTAPNTIGLPAGVQEVGALRGEFHDFRAETRGELAEQREDVRAGFSQITGRLDVLERRTYDLGSRLP